jgi:hypothetical protein
MIRSDKVFFGSSLITQSRGTCSLTEERALVITPSAGMEVFHVCHVLSLKLSASKQKVKNQMDTIRNQTRFQEIL